MQTRHLHRLVENGSKLRDFGVSWRGIAKQLEITQADGKPDPGLAYRIIQQGYDPKRPETRKRLHLPPVCPTCRQRTPRQVPEWVTEATNNLSALRNRKEELR